MHKVERASLGASLRLFITLPPFPCLLKVHIDICPSDYFASVLMSPVCLTYVRYAHLLKKGDIQ